ncbi:MAG: D-glucuronyl C5-epimerase family protein [Candidatus Aquilonibacter sp.]
MNPRAAYNELRRMFPTSWSMTRQYRLPTDDPGQPYFIAWNPGPRPAGEGWNEATFDDDGLFTLGAYRNPVTISQFALTQHALAQRGHAQARVYFLSQAEWLMRAQRDDGAIPYPVDSPIYGAKSGWISGMAQGEVASVLLRAFIATGDSRFRDAGVQALAPLARDVRDGGASYIDGRDVFFEEVASARPHHILNGHIYAAFALWEYTRFGLADETLRALHHDAVRTLESWLSAFDADGWSCYDLATDDEGRRHYARLWYHQFHIAQLRVYAAMTERDEFERMARRWHDAMLSRDVQRRVWRYHVQTLIRSARRRVIREAPAPLVPP